MERTLQRWQIAGNTGSRVFKWEMEPLVSYAIQDLCCLSCQEQKSIRLELEANPGAERRRTLSRWISHVRFESFLTHSTWQCKQQRRPQCELEPRKPAFGGGRWTVKHTSAKHWDLLLGVKHLILGDSSFKKDYRDVIKRCLMSNSLQYCTKLGNVCFCS